MTARAAGILLVHDGYVLLLKRAASAQDEPETWGLPGGHIEPGETPEQAARREYGEECGGAPYQGKLTKLYTSPDGFICFGGSGYGEPTLNHEHTEWKWAPFDELPEPLHPGMQELTKMPLIEGKSDKARSENIGKEIAAGKSPKQAEAIGYAVQRKVEHAQDDADAFRQNLDNLHQCANDCMTYDRKRK